MAFACALVMPVLLLFDERAFAWPLLMPVFAVFAVTALACSGVMPTFAVLSLTDFVSMSKSDLSLATSTPWPI